ncbi:MAG TPA: hypothetical protein DCO72_07000 [Ruminococcus sp.]|nr:hypothetical protein [Ruminococcus sp.]
MKKLLVLLMGISVILVGCGNAQEVTSTADVQTTSETLQITQSSEEIPETEVPQETIPETTIPEVTVPDTPQTEETPSQADDGDVSDSVPSNSPEEAQETQQITRTEENSALETVPEEVPEPETKPVSPKPDKGVVINAYISAIQDKIAVAKQQGSGSGNFSVTYSLYDMDRDDVPELLLQYGTCEADFRIVIYTVRDNALKLISDDVGGGHTGFAYDYKANQLVLAQGHMGSGIMTWYDLDENGNLRYLIDSDAFQFAGDGLPEYEDVMKKYNVAWLNGATSSSIGGETTTYVYTYSDYQYSSQEYDGLDFRYLQDYPF